jgi:hypothetical protein
MVQGNGAPGLLQEAAQELGIMLEVGRQDLESHVAVVDGISDLVDHGHATSPDLFQDVELAQHLAEQVESHSCLLIGPYAAQS